MPYNNLEYSNMFYRCNNLEYPKMSYNNLEYSKMSYNNLEYSKIFYNNLEYYSKMLYNN